jgi:hypothetical protein
MARWSVPLDRLARASGARMDTVVRRAVFTLFQKVVLRSPVDTGRFRANWNVTLGAPDYATSDNTASSRGVTEATKVLGWRAGGVYWMANGLPYAQRLEYGWSGQAPNGMVRVSVVEFEAGVRALGGAR